MAGIKKIELMLIDGTANGILQVRIHPSTITSYVMPRKLLSGASKLSGIDRHGVYFLFDKARTHVYVGQTTNGIHRIEDHNRTKEFWDTAILFLADNKTFNLDSISGLEKFLIEKAKETAIYQVKNAVVPKFQIDPFDLPTIQDFYGDICLIMATLGYPLEITEEDKPKETVYRCVRKNAEAKMAIRGAQYVVLSGSKLNPVESPSIHPSASTLRKKLIAEGKLDKDSMVLQVDVAFPSPSAAAVFVYGASANGWTEWVNESGATIDKIIRNKDVTKEK